MTDKQIRELFREAFRKFVAAELDRHAGLTLAQNILAAEKTWNTLTAAAQKQKTTEQTIEENTLKEQQTVRSSMPSAASAIRQIVAKEATERGDGQPSRFKDVKVTRGGEQIVLPEGMSYGEAHQWLAAQEEAEEKVVNIGDNIPCFPLDGIVALSRALREVYGFTDLRDTVGRWGEKVTATLYQVETSNGQLETAPIGRLAVPKWEGGYLEAKLIAEPVLLLSGHVKRKYEAEVKQILRLTRKFLQENSIYKGQAISVDLSFIEKEMFDPTNDAPKFMDIKDVSPDMLILNDVTDFELRANIFTLIERSDVCLSNSIPLKHGALFMGPYGVGKTLTARVCAKKCVDNGWTFIYLKKTRHLANALTLAQMYAPALVFGEDIDQVMTGGRNQEVNKILNTIDGVDTKGKPIITILTTNRPDLIEPALLRAGRIDTVISFDAPDAKTAVRFVQHYAKDEHGHSLLIPGCDLTDAGEELAGFVPAFMAEAVQKAKRFAIHREGGNIMGKVTAEDVLLAAKALKKHIEMVKRKHKLTDAQIVAQAVRVLEVYGCCNSLNDLRQPGSPIAFDALTECTDENIEASESVSASK